MSNNVNLLEKYWGEISNKEIVKKEIVPRKWYKGILQRVILKNADEINKRTNQPYGRDFLTFTIWIPELNTAAAYFLTISAYSQEEVGRVVAKINILIRQLKLEHSKDFKEAIQRFLDLDGKNLKVLYKKRDPNSLNREDKYDVLKIDPEIITEPKVIEKQSTESDIFDDLLI